MKEQVARCDIIDVSKKKKRKTYINQLLLRERKPFERIIKKILNLFCLQQFDSKYFNLSNFILNVLTIY